MRIALLVLLSVLSMGNRGCNSPNDPLPTSPYCGPNNVLQGHRLAGTPSRTLSLTDSTGTAGVSSSSLVSGRAGLTVTLDRHATVESLRSHDIIVKRYWPRLGIAVVEPRTSTIDLIDLVTNPSVIGVESPYRFKALDHIRTTGGDCLRPWVEISSASQRQIGADLVWGRSSGSGVRVAVLDTGVNMFHDELRGRVAAARNFVPAGGVFNEGAAVDPEAWDDDNGHGSHIAGIIAANRDEVGMLGVAPSATLVTGKVLDADGYGSDLMLIDGLDWALSQNAHIVNMSLGSPEYSMALSRAIEVVNASGVVLVAAAGNSGDTAAGDLNEPNFPASFPEVVSVAAVTSGNDRALFSTFNEFVDISAPGTSVVAPYIGEYEYACMDGTSQASAFVSGTFALLKGALPELSHEDLKRRLVCSALDIGDWGVDNETGYGLVRVDDAVTTEPTELCGYPGAPIPRPEPTPTPVPSAVPGDRSDMLIVTDLSASYLNTEEHPSTLVIRVRVTNGWRTPIPDATLRIDTYNAETDTYLSGGAFVTNDQGLAYARLNPVNCGTIRISVPLVQKPGYEYRADMSRQSTEYTFGR